MTCHLSHLQPGTKGVIATIAGRGLAKANLAARGIIPGVGITVIRQGDPVIFEVDNSRWALDCDEADSVDVVVSE